MEHRLLSEDLLGIQGLEHQVKKEPTSDQQCSGTFSSDALRFLTGLSQARWQVSSMPFQVPTDQIQTRIAVLDLSMRVRHATWRSALHARDVRAVAVRRGAADACQGWRRWHPSFPGAFY